MVLTKFVLIINYSSLFVYFVLKAARPAVEKIHYFCYAWCSFEFSLINNCDGC